MSNLLAFPTRRSDGRYSDLSAYPATDQGWKDRYGRLWDAYIGDQYDLAEVKAFHLFRALDDTNEEIDQTRRVFMVGRFITDTDTHGVLGGGRVALEMEDGFAKGDDAARMAMLEAGERVWKRSRVDERIEGWVRTTAALGDYYVEAVRMTPRTNGTYGTTLVGYDPRNVTPYYDAITSTRLVRVDVETGYLGGGVVSGDGTVDDDTPHTYRRVITETRIDVWIDGEHRPELSGEHGAGTIPVVHMQFTPFTEPDHGLPAAAGVDQAVMMCDSLATQGKAIGSRYANPIGYLSGARLSDGSAIARFGRWLGLPVDAKVGYIEPTGNLAQQLREQIDQILDHVRRTAPEFMFADNETNVSGESLTAKASAFEAKIGSARKRIFGALCRITAIAVAMDADEVADVERKVYRIDAGPILPKNAKIELEMLNSIADKLTPGDYVRHLQRLGWVGLHEDPDEYAAKVAAGKTKTKATALPEPKPQAETPEGG